MRSFSSRYASEKSETSCNNASMAGAMARKSSMASAPLTLSVFCNAFKPSLQFFQTCDNAMTTGSSLRPLGVVTRGNATSSATCAALSQRVTRFNASMPAAAVRNLSP